MKNVFVNGGDQIVTRQYMTRLVLVVVSKATHSAALRTIADKKYQHESI